MRRMLAMTCLTIALTAGAAAAASPHPPVAEPHPDIPQNPAWVKGVLTGIFLLFAFAIPVGIIIRANMPDEPPSDPHDAHGGEHGDDGHGHATPAHGAGHH